VGQHKAGMDFLNFRRSGVLIVEWGFPEEMGRFRNLIGRDENGRERGTKKFVENSDVMFLIKNL
jgi:hypothetical protein